MKRYVTEGERQADSQRDFPLQKQTVEYEPEPRPGRAGSLPCQSQKPGSLPTRRSANDQTQGAGPILTRAGIAPCSLGSVGKDPHRPLSGAASEPPCGSVSRPFQLPDPPVSRPCASPGLALTSADLDWSAARPDAQPRARHHGSGRERGHQRCLVSRASSRPQVADRSRSDRPGSSVRPLSAPSEAIAWS